MFRDSINNSVLMLPMGLQRREDGLPEDLKVFRSRATVTSQHPVMVQSDVGEGRLIPEHNRAVVTSLSLILLHSGS